METVQYYRYTEAWEDYANSKELPTNIPLVSRIQKLYEYIISYWTE